jgi:hypothetical protein
VKKLVCLETGDPKVIKALKLLGIPDEAYREIVITIKMGEPVKVKAEFLAKGGE